MRLPKTSVRVTISTTESIAYPTSQDITITDKGALGKDIEIRLNVTGTVSSKSKTETLDIPVEIIDAGEPLNEQGVRNAVGSKEYNITTEVLKDEVIKNTKQDKLTSGSDVEID